MVKTRCWSVAVVTAFLAVTAGGCTHLVHEWELEGLLDPVEAQLADHDGRITTLESDVAGIQNDVAELRRRMDQLANDFGAHVNDESVHCPCGLSVSLPVHFDFNADEVRDVDEPILDAFSAAVMGSYPNATVTVEGFADPAGSAQYNIGLSRRRAQTVKDYLVGTGGMDGDKVRVAALGEARPVTPGAQGPGQSGIENRRVTFVLEWAGLNDGSGN